MRKDQNKLTPRECDVLSLASTGMSTKQIADKLCISRATASTYLQMIHQKYNVQTRISAVLKGIALGEIPNALSK